MGEKTLFEAYLLALTPLGFLGGLHFYLNRPHVGLLYLLTFGVFGFGYLVDIVRTPMLVKDANLRRLHKKDPTQPAPPAKRITDAYLMWFPLGIISLHHVYLKRPNWALLYAGTFGLFAVGWLVDGFWLISMVRETNQQISQSKEKNHQIKQEVQSEKKKNKDAPTSTEVTSPRSDISRPDDTAQEGKIKQKETRATLAFGFSVLGMFGAHHYYLGRFKWGLLYTISFGLLGTGWIADWIRLPFLVKRSNAILRKEIDMKEKTLDDAYVLWFSWGIFGLHHFYLGRVNWGFIYLLTGGVFIIGWLMDGIRMPALVKEANQRRISHDSTVNDVEANITPAADDYDDNSLTLDIGENTDDAADDANKADDQDTPVKTKSAETSAR